MAKRVWTIDLAGVVVNDGMLNGVVQLKKNDIEQASFSVDFTESITSALCKHGLKQKLQDNYAGLEKRGGTIEDHIEAVEKVITMLNKGMFKTSKVKEAAVTLKGAITKALMFEDSETMLKMAFLMFGATFDQKLVDKVKSELEDLEDDNEE